MRYELQIKDEVKKLQIKDHYHGCELDLCLKIFVLGHMPTSRSAVASPVRLFDSRFIRKLTSLSCLIKHCGSDITSLTSALAYAFSVKSSSGCFKKQAPLSPPKLPLHEVSSVVSIAYKVDNRTISPALHELRASPSKTG